MKVLHVINSLNTGGAEKLIVDTLPRYRDAGIDVDLLILNGAETPFYQKMQETFRGNIYISSKGSVYNPFHIISLRKYLINYDIIHVHLFPSLYWVALCKILFRIKAKLIFTEHNITNRRFSSSLFLPIDRFIYKGYSSLVAITEPIRLLIERRLKLQNKTQLIENGVDLAQIRTAEPYSKQSLLKKIGIQNENAILILQVSAFRAQKDQQTLINAVQYLDEKCVVLLAGDGELRKEIEDLVAKLKLKDRVLFLGNRSDIPSLLKSVDVVVLSSKYEGMSLSSIEGMASGKPFIASDVPGLREIVAGAGVLFPCGDAKRLAEEISNLLVDKEHYKSIAQKCQERAAKYDISVMVEKHIELYKSL